VNNSVRQEIVIQTWQEGTTPCNKLDASVYIDTQAITARDCAQDAFALLSEKLLLRGKMLEN
jgi:hypothetical protein